MKIHINYCNNSIRFRFSIGKKRYSFYPGITTNDPQASLKAKRIKQLMELDFLNQKFNPQDLSRYKIEAQYLSATQLFQSWIKEKANYLDPQTIDWYRQGAGKNLQDYFGNQKSIITKAEAIEFMGWLLKQGRQPETQKRKIESLKACWDWGIERGLVSENPWTDLAKLIRVQDTEIIPFKKAEVKEIIEAFSVHPRYKQLTPFVRFLFATGCRIGEAIGLKWRDISHDFKSCSVTRLRTRGKVKNMKNRKVRLFYLPKSIQLMLEEMGRENPDDWVFLWNGKPINGQNFTRRVWASILKSLGIEYRPPKFARKTFSSHALAEGHSPADISKMVGNQPRVLLEHYIGVLHQPQLPDLF